MHYMLIDLDSTALLITKRTGADGFNPADTFHQLTCSPVHTMLKIGTTWILKFTEFTSKIILTSKVGRKKQNKD